MSIRLASAGLFLVACCAAGADTLREIYELALENDAQLKARQAQYRASLETENLGRSALLPRIDAGYEYTKSDTDTISQSFDFDRQLGGIASVETSSNVDIDNEGYQVSLRQAIFDLPAWFAFRAGRETSREAEATFSADQQDLIVRTVESYLGVLRAQDDLEASRARERAFQRRLEQTRQRFEVGLIAITEVHEAQAAYDLSRVDRITDENGLNVALERLSVLTGRYHANLHLLREDFDTKSPEPAGRDAWVDFALANNFRLAAATYAEEAARQNARANRMEHLPKVSGSISYSDFETAGRRTVTPPTGFDTSPDSDQEREVYSISLNLPLYSGGRISATRRRAAQQYLAARETRIDLMRQVVTETRSLHMTVLSDIANVAARGQSIVSSRSALEATTAGYEVGTRNVVDVLNAQNVLFGARRDYANARYDYVRNMLRLKQQAGLLSPEDIHRLDAELVAPPAPTAAGRGAAAPYPAPPLK